MRVSLLQLTVVLLDVCFHCSSVIHDLIGEATETKKAIDEAYEGVERANAALQAPPAPAPSFDQDLFGFGGDAASTSAPTPTQPYQESYPTHVATAASFASQDSQPHHVVEQQPSYTSHQSEQVAHEPVPSYQQYTVPLSNFGQETGDNYYGGGPTHRKNQSTGSFGNIMGGDVGALPPDNHSMSPYASQQPSLTGQSQSPSMDDINVLRKNLKEAEDVARDAEDSRRSIAAELDEIRKLADEADQKARQFQADIDKQASKKKGLLGGRGKKKDPKEGDQLTADFNQKKAKVMSIQAQLKDAEALAADTKKEAERLRKEIEETEVHLASAASIQPSQSAAATYSYGAPPPASNYGMTPPLDAAPSWFPQSQTASAVSNGDNGVGGFDSNVMGGGGFSIPEPLSGSTDPYSNPFE